MLKRRVSKDTWIFENIVFLKDIYNIFCKENEKYILSFRDLCDFCYDYSS